MSELTLRDLQVLDFIMRYQEKHGRRPTYEVIGQELRIKATSQVQQHVKRLEQAGRIRLLYVTDGPKEAAKR